MNLFPLDNHQVADDVLFRWILSGFSTEDEHTIHADGCFFVGKKKDPMVCVPL